MLLAASWRAAGRADDVAAARGLSGANKSADEFAVDERGDFFDVEAGGSEKFAGLFDFVNARGLDVHGFEASSIKLVSVFVLLEGAGDTADPELHALTNGSRHFTANDDVGNGEAAAGLQDAEGFAEDAILIAGKIDDAIGDDDVHGVVGKRNVFNRALQELNIFDAGFFLIFAGEGEHFVGHVQTIGFASGADTFCGEDDVNAAARAEIEDDFAGLELR